MSKIASFFFLLVYTITWILLKGKARGIDYAAFAWTKVVAKVGLITAANHINKYIFFSKLSWCMVKSRATLL